MNRSLRTVPLLVGLVCLVPTMASAALLKGEAEVSGGYAFQGGAAPMFGLRGGIDILNFLTPQLRFEDVLGNPRTYGPRAWALMPGVRLHLPFNLVSAYLGADLGVGRLTQETFADPSYTTLTGPAALSYQVEAGIRVGIGALRLGAEASTLVLTQVTGGRTSGPAEISFLPPGAVPLYMVQLTVGGVF